MSAGLVVLWLGTVSARATHEPDLASWADSRMTVLEDPPLDPPLRAAVHDDDIAKQAEDALAEARAATFSPDSLAARDTLDGVERLLTSHPELPEAAWLMAEAWRDRAEISRAGSPAEAGELERRAAALDGPEAQAFVAGARPPTAAAAPAAPSAPAVARVPLTGPLPSDEVEIDGADVGRPLTLSEGVHVVRVLRRGRLAWAGWVTAGADPVRAAVPGVTPCSETDLSSVRITADRVEADGAACPRFALARPSGSERIDVSVCDHAGCTTWLPWSRSWGQAFEGPMQPSWPVPPRKTWILWTAAGVAALVAGGFILEQEGAFERHGAAQDRFVWMGPSGK